MVRKKKPSQMSGTVPADKTGAPMVPNGLEHGGRKQLETAIQATQAAREDGPATASSAPRGGVIPDGGVFGPTDRPNEPVTAGLPFGPGPNGSPGQLGPRARMEIALSEAYRMTGSEHILRMMDRLR